MPVTLQQLPKELHELTDYTAFEFHDLADKNAQDPNLKRAVNKATLHQYTQRQARMTDLPDPDGIRTLAGDIKQHTLDYLDYYLEQLKANVEKNGGHVHFARDATDARRIIMDIADKANCKKVIKSKSMASEEIELAHLMESRGLDVVETDLGEFIIQINHDRPSHIVAPVIHMETKAIADLFCKYFGSEYCENPKSLADQARFHLRDKFRRADLGMTGGNFLVAETGHICVVENEGNARQSMTSPRVLVSLVGIEKVVPRLADLAVMLKLLGRSATGQAMTIYTSIFGGPRAPGEKDGPEEFHLVLLDNGRTEILASEEYRETLRCIRCGACLNACPVYRKIGGHAYGYVYSGPIGALITPLMKGLHEFKDLPQASSLCGACYEACPVKINIPQHLINLRRDIVKTKISGKIERFVYRTWAKTLKWPWMYKLNSQMQKWVLRFKAGKTGWVKKLPAFGSGWTQIRDMPAPAKKTFRQMWKKRP
ncbi:MAG TPA: LutB/LldF family L-lactate oxidation iron-sulfur protein [Tepidisphaeraceae bacterium]|nr:LutB/LldF family L-lactate oxidation iron-sulfur protein [Tepidisphaeraceae bacterium]